MQYYLLLITTILIINIYQKLYTSHISVWQELLLIRSWVLPNHSVLQYQDCWPLWWFYKLPQLAMNSVKLQNLSNLTWTNHSLPNTCPLWYKYDNMNTHIWWQGLHEFRPIQYLTPFSLPHPAIDISWSSDCKYEHDHHKSIPFNLIESSYIHVLTCTITLAIYIYMCIYI